MTQLTRQEKIDLINKLIKHKRGMDVFQEKFDELFGVKNGFVGSSEGHYNVFNELFNDFIQLVAKDIGESDEGIDWFVHENDCGAKGMQAGIDGEDFREIRSIDDYLWLVELDSAGSIDG